MRQRSLLIGVIVIVSLALGLLVAGLPGRDRDRPLSARVAAAPGAAAPTTASKTTTSTTTTAGRPATTVARIRAAADVQVRVANASTLSLAATHMSSRLTGLGYQPLAPLDANRSDLSSTVVVFTPGFEPEAGALARAIGASSVVSADPTLSCDAQACGGDVVVFVGNDLAT